MWRTPVNVLCLNIFYWISYRFQGLLWPWSYGSWIYNYLCLSPLMLWVRISIRARCTALCDKVCQWLATGRWFSQDPLVSSTNKTDRHDITEKLFKVALNTIKPNLMSYTVSINNWNVICKDFDMNLHPDFPFGEIRYLHFR
jgi:hypothetical protein